jgi:mevalonate kinase
MNETPTISIIFKFEEERSVRTITSELPYTGDFENLKQIVSEAQLMLYNLGYSNELVEQAVKESNIF